MADVGRLLVIAGLSIAVLGVLFTVGGRVPFLGHLPGDILIRRGSSSLYFPIVTCILLSIVLTVALNVIGTLLRH
jgi:hypothetical protein